MAAAGWQTELEGGGWYRRLSRQSLASLAALLPPNHRFLSFGFLLSSLVWEWPPFWFHRGHCWPYLVLMSQSFSAVALAFETFLNSVTEKKGKSRRPWTCFGLAGSLMHHLSPIRKLHKCNQWELETNQRKKRENFLSGAEEPSLKSSKPLKRKLTCDLYLWHLPTFTTALGKCKSNDGYGICCCWAIWSGHNPVQLIPHLHFNPPWKSINSVKSAWHTFHFIYLEILTWPVLPLWPPGARLKSAVKGGKDRKGFILTVFLQFPPP